MVTIDLLVLAQTITEGPAGSELASWRPLRAFGIVFAVILVAMVIIGRHPRPLLRIPAGLQRVTGIPAWAASTLLFSIYGLAVAGYGFYTDVTYHIAYGRDDVLFTSPHTAIFIGLCMIAAAPVVGIGVATLERVPTQLRAGPLHVPWSALPLGVLGLAAVIGFPIDELWHRQYGVDVTMWSPPHLIMILGASFSGLASWLVLADAGVRPSDGVGPRIMHLIAAALTLQGLSSVQGEFSYGVPQWQQLYHPVLVCLAAGMALTVIRLVHGRFIGLGIAAFLFAAQAGGSDGPVQTRAGAIYIGSAIAVELAAMIVGTRHRLRFALVAGAGVLAIGLPVEWLWNTGAHQPWTAALLPEAVLVGGLAALAAAVLGTAVGGAISGDLSDRPVPAVALALALAGVLVALAIPSPRQVGDVTAHVTLDWVDDDRAIVNVRLDPPDAAEGARYFTVGSWQWGGRTIRHMQRVGDGEYTSRDPLILTGWAKSLVRLHRGAEMMAVAVRLPADPAYGLPAVQAVDRTTAFVSEQQYLQREADPALGWFSWVVYALVLVLAVAWVGSLWLASARIGRGGRETRPVVPAG